MTIEVSSRRAFKRFRTLRHTGLARDITASIVYEQPLSTPELQLGRNHLVAMASQLHEVAQGISSR